MEGKKRTILAMAQSCDPPGPVVGVTIWRWMDRYRWRRVEAEGRSTQFLLFPLTKAFVYLPAAKQSS